MKKKEHPLIQIQEQALKVGLSWIAKVNLRCTLEGCRYGNELIDREPLDKCMYCGIDNMAKENWWMDFKKSNPGGKKRKVNK